MMRKTTVHAGFDSAFQKFTVTATVFAQCIERTIAEEAVKVLLFNPLVAGKIFTFFVLKKFIIFTHNAIIISLLRD